MSLREDIAKLEQLDRETLFLARKGITSIGQLSQQLKKLHNEMALCKSIALRSEQVKDNLACLLLQGVVERKRRISQKRKCNFNIEK